MTSQHRPPPTRFNPTSAQRRDGGYKLLVGAYMHQGAQAAGLPPSLAGHAFVGVEGPDGSRQTFGFSPANFSGMDPRRDQGRLNTGVQGKVHDDAAALSKPGVRTTAIPISAAQARAALAKVQEYKAVHPDFSASRRQCTTFAADVAGAAGVKVNGSGDPRGFYQSLQRKTGVLQGRFLQCKGDAFALPQTFSLPAGGGRALPDEVRGKMERFFGTDFSGVRVHVGPEAPAIGALAFTVGETIVFAPGQYDPTTPRGQQLLGHELAHVVQQRSGRVRNPFGNGLAVVNDPGLEAEADRLGMRAAWGG